MEIINKAMEFATKKHEGQIRKGSPIPYIVHPYDVMQILKGAEASEKVIAAGILHDTLEDTETTKEELELEFGKEIATWVECETEDKSKPYIERKTEHMAKISMASIEVKAINCADKIANLRATSLDYPTFVGEEYWQRFNRGRDVVKWYYGLAIESLKELEENNKYKNMYDNLIFIYNKIFSN
ncbi:MAG: HD domain-containing protein [Spirochaetales bacterium]